MPKSLPSFLDSTVSALLNEDYLRARQLLSTREAIGFSAKPAIGLLAFSYVQEHVSTGNPLALEQAVVHAVHGISILPDDPLSLQVLAYAHAVNYFEGDVRSIVPAVDCLNRLRTYFILTGNTSAEFQINQRIQGVLHASG